MSLAATRISAMCMDKVGLHSSATSLDAASPSLCITITIITIITISIIIIGIIITLEKQAEGTCSAPHFHGALSAFRETTRDHNASV